MKVTNREKNLLAFLGILTIGAIFVFFIIMPLQKSISDRKATYLGLLDQKTLLDAQIENGKSLESKLTTALEHVNLEFAKIEKTISSDEFELRVQPFLVSNAITVSSWVVNESTVSKPELPTYQKTPYDYKLQVLLDNYLSNSNQPFQIPVSDSELMKTSITVSFTSNYDVYVQFLDEIAGWNSTVYISACSREASTGASVVTIDLYSVSKP